MATKQFMLIAGVDFIDFEIDFGALCKLRVNELIDLHKGTAELRFLIFDFQRGTVTTILVPAGIGVKTETIDQRFDPITINDYPDFQKGSQGNLISADIKDKLSITDVYAEMIALGKASPGTLIEWSLFSRGPGILAYSLGDDAVHGSKKLFNKLPKGSRDPEDLDMYFGRDFAPPRMSEQDLTNLRNAFHQDGYGWMWSDDWNANVPDPVVDAILKTSEIYDPALPDEVFVKLEMDPDHNNPLSAIVLVENILPAAEVKKMFSSTKGKTKQIIFNFEIPLGALRRNICGLNNYKARSLAQSFGVKVYAVFDTFSVRYAPLNNELPTVSIYSESTYSSLKKMLHMRDDLRKGYFAHEPHLKRCITPVFDPAIFKNRKYAEDFKTPPAKKSTPLVLPALPKPTHPFFRLSEYSRHYVFVTGVDYLNRGIDYKKKALHRINLLLANDVSRESCLFHILDFASGTVAYCEVEYTDGTKTVSDFEVSTFNRFARVRFSVDDLIKFDPVKNDTSMYTTETDGMGNTKTFLREQNASIMNMDFVYGRIIEVGKKAPGKLIEFSFFTDGDETGPKPVNQLTRDEIRTRGLANVKNRAITQDDFTAIEKKLANYICHDPEPNFSVELFDDENTKLFNNAFHERAITWCWGYEIDPDLRKLMKAMLESKEYLAGNLKDDTLITLRNPTPRMRLFAQRVAGLLSKREVPPVKIEIPFGNLLYLFADIMKSSYMYAIAVFSQKEAYGPLPGIRILPEIENDFALFVADPLDKKISAFYKTHFGLDFDSEKRGYGRYVHNFPWDASNLAGIRIEEEILDEIQKFPVE